jgi:hypothetical protein
MDLTQFDIPWKSLRRDFFAEIEHPEYEIMFQDLVCGTSRLYLTKFNGYWLLLHRIRSETKWLIEDNIHNYSLSMMMAAKENDKRPVVAQILFSLWLFHYNWCFGSTADSPLNDIQETYKHTVLRGGSNSLGYLGTPIINRLIHAMNGKTVHEASAWLLSELSD